MKDFDTVARENGYQKYGRLYINVEEDKSFSWNGLNLLADDVGVYFATITCTGKGLAGFVGYEKAFEALRNSKDFHRDLYRESLRGIQVA